MENIARVQSLLMETVGSVLLQIQTETDRRADVMLGRLVQHVHDVSEQTNKRWSNNSRKPCNVGRDYSASAECDEG
jgi:hypothetical protein